LTPHPIVTAGITDRGHPVTERLSLRGYGGFVGWGNRTRRVFLKQLVISGASIAAGSALAATLDLWRAAAATAGAGPGRLRVTFFRVTDPPFRARGDGHTDDGPAIQAAIDAASALGGGVVLLPAGTYRLGSVHEQPGVRFFLLNMRSHVSLIGEGMDKTMLKAGDHLPDQTRIISTASTGGESLVVGPTFQDFTVDGNAAAQPDAGSNVGISCVHTVDASHLRVRVQDVKGTGHGEGAAFDSFFAAGSTYQRCVARRTGPGPTGSGFSATESREISYQDCESSGSTVWQGFTTYRSEGIDYLRCHGSQNGQRGFNCEESQLVTYTGCLAGGPGLGNAGEGFHLFYSSGITLDGCQSIDNRGSGLRNMGSTAVQVLGGAFADGVLGLDLAA
jgi:pectate lyase-like protein